MQVEARRERCAEGERSRKAARKAWAWDSRVVVVEDMIGKWV